VAADAATGGLDGKRVLIEGFAEHGPALAAAVAARGATIVGISTTAGVQLNAEGLDASELREGWAANGPGLVGEDADAAWKIFGADADVLFAGSKMGAINHDTAGKLNVGAVVPHAAIPYTARALAVMTKNDIVAVPDFVSTAGPLLAYWPADAGADAGSVVSAATDAITSIINETKGHDDGGFLGACYRAEAFIKTWQDAAPFGRPLAS
jgi:glutamate dehydrogenase (NAD(P)+)